MTKELDWNQGDFSINLKPVEISKSHIYIICTSSKVALICKVRRVWLKNYACHTHLDFKMLLAGNPFLLQLELSPFASK